MSFYGEQYNKAVEEFDPNNMDDPETPEAATFCPTRFPDFKIHKKMGHARNAISNHGFGKLYKWTGFRWELIDTSFWLNPEEKYVCAGCEEVIENPYNENTEPRWYYRNWRIPTGWHKGHYRPVHDGCKKR